MLKPITSIEVVEIVIKDTISKKYYLPELLQVRGKKIKYIIAQPNFINGAPTRNVLVPDAVQNSTYLTLVSKGKEELNQYPITYLFPAQDDSNKSVNEKPIEINKIIDWPKSYLQINNLTGIATGQSFVFYILYDEPSLVPKPAEKIKLDVLHVDFLEFETVPAGSKTRYNFPDNEKLRGKRIVGIEFPSGFITSPNGYDVGFSGFINLNVNGKIEIHDVISDIFARPNYGISRISFNYLKVDWPKSYIDLFAAPSASNRGVYLTIYYKD